MSRSKPIPAWKEVTSAHQSRLAIFQATRRAKKVEDLVIENPWGSCTITGCLGQPHQDLLDASFFLAEEAVPTDDGRLYLLVDPYKLRRFLKSTSASNIEKLIKDLFDAEVEISIPKREIHRRGRILDEVAKKSRRTCGNPLERTKGTRATIKGQRLHGVVQTSERRLLVLIISSIWVSLMVHDLRIGYSLNVLERIVSMPHGITQALARWCYTHRNVNEPVSQVVGYLRFTGRLSDRLSEVRSDTEALAAIGIHVDGDWVRYSG